MLQTIEMINSAVNNFVWGIPAMVCIIGVGLLLSLRTGFLQIRKFPYAIKTTLGRMFRKREASDGSMTPFQAVCTALAATVGTGGVVGGFFLSIQKGISRGIFSNEAGLGTGSIAHACADTQKPVKQGFFGIFEVFTDTILICTLTALVILCSGVPVGYGSAAGAELTILGFTSTYGNWVSIFTAVAMCCFAFSTIIGWGLYGARCIEFLFSSKVIKPFMVVYSLVAILGATVDLGLLWSIAETFNGLMSIPNLIALFLLSGTVVRLVREYFSTEGQDA
jgi:amino acid carrier protein